MSLWGFSQPWQSKFHQISLRSVYVLSPDLPQSFSVEMEFDTFDIGFESACSATCIGVTH